MECPYCAEDIKDRAIKCKYCGSMLNGINNSRSVEKGIKLEKTKESLGVFLVIGLVILCVFVGSSTNLTVAVVILLIGLVGIFKYYWS